MADYSVYGTPSADWIAFAPSMPAPPPGLTIEQLVELTNKGREATSAEEMISQGLADAVTLQDHSIQSRDGGIIEARSYRPKSVSLDQKLPIYINLHGGGFLFGTLPSEDAACSRIVHTLASESYPITVLNVNYRHTPQHTFPTAWHDVEDALVWTHAHLDLLGADGSQLVIGGISAGGQLSASITLQQHLGIGPLTSLPRIRGQVLIIPCLVNPDTYDLQRAKLASPEVSSYVTQKNAPVLDVARVRLFTGLLKLPESFDVKDRLLNPGNADAEEVKGLPPSVFGIAGADPLRDEGLFYAELLAGQGVPTDVTVFRGVPHGFRRFGDKLSASKAWDAVTANGIRWCLSSPQAGQFTIKTD